MPKLVSKIMNPFTALKNFTVSHSTGTRTKAIYVALVL